MKEDHENIRRFFPGRLYVKGCKTSSLTVAERPRVASCLLVAAIVQYVERKFRFRFTTAYSSNLFCSLRRGRPCRLW